MSKKWTRNAAGDRLESLPLWSIPLDRESYILANRSPNPGLNALLADANKGAEAEQIEEAMLAMKAAGEKLRVYREEDKLKASGFAVRCALGDLWDSLKLCPATAGDLKTARITSVEGKIKDAETVLQAARTELKELKNV